MKLQKILVLASFAVSTAIPVSIPTAACAESSTPVVVRFPEGRTENICVSATPGSSGLEALRASGLGVATTSFGGVLGEAVCKIEGVGNDLSDCPGAAAHWHYWKKKDGVWKESSLGASSSKVEVGVAEGWTWVEGVEAKPPSSDLGQPGTCKALVRSSPTPASSTLPAGVAVGGVLAASLGLTAYWTRRKSRAVS